MSSCPSRSLFITGTSTSYLRSPAAYSDAATGGQCTKSPKVLGRYLSVESYCTETQWAWGMAGHPESGRHSVMESYLRQVLGKA